MPNRGRRCKELSKLSNYFSKRNKKSFSSKKFGDDKARAFARNILEYNLYCIPKETKKKLKSFKKYKSQAKSTEVIKIISNNPDIWDKIMAEFMAYEFWINRIEFSLNIRYKGDLSEKESVFTKLLENIINYLKIKGDKLIKKCFFKHNKEDEPKIISGVDTSIKKEEEENNFDDFSHIKTEFEDENISNEILNINYDSEPQYQEYERSITKRSRSQSFSDVSDFIYNLDDD